MKITVYTIKDCAFSKQEKEYLNTNKLIFEEKDLETNKDFLTEMLAISNSFAGTPVTRVEKDDGTITVLKGFTKEEFDTTFGLVPIPAQAQVGDTPITVAETVSPAPVTESPVETPITTPNLSASKDAAAVADSLQSVMDNLQSKTQPEVTPPPVAAPPVSEIPVSPPTSIDPATPSIPDFPAK